MNGDICQSADGIRAERSGELHPLGVDRQGRFATRGGRIGAGGVEHTLLVGLSYSSLYPEHLCRVLNQKQACSSLLRDEKG